MRSGQFFCRFSRCVVDLSEFGETKKYGEGLLGKTACVCAEDITLQAGTLASFGNVRCPVVGCIERYSTRKLVHYRFVTLEISNRYLFMTLIGKRVSPELPWLTDDILEALSLLDVFEEFERVLFRWADIFGVEGGSWYAYMKSRNPSVYHALKTSKRIKQEIDHGRSLDSLKTN